MLSFAPVQSFIRVNNSRPAKVARQRIAFVKSHAKSVEASAVTPCAAETSTGPAFSGSAFSGPDPQRYDFTSVVSVPCFVKGTRIQTPGLSVPIENLKVGDTVVTRDNGAQKIRWIVATELAANAQNAPIEFAAGAFGNAVATRVSPSHRVLLSGWRCKKISGAEEVFAQARDLVNNRDVTRIEGGSVIYYHMALDSHQVVIADGMSSETFHPNRISPRKLEASDRDNLIALFPEVGAAPNAYGPHARPDIKPFEARLIRP